jgi:hypothetical protein
MSVREPKGRLLSREYMADREFMTAFTPAEREWYLLTALFADDSGYLPWDLPDNAANVYRYEIPSDREELVAGYVAHLAATGRFVDLGCGHALMPRVAKRPRGHRRESTVQAEHSQCSGNASESNRPPIQSYPVQSFPIQSVAREPANGSDPADPSGAGPAPWAMTSAKTILRGFGYDPESTASQPEVDSTSDPVDTSDPEP